MAIACLVSSGNGPVNFEKKLRAKITLIFLLYKLSV